MNTIKTVTDDTEINAAFSKLDRYLLTDTLGEVAKRLVNLFELCPEIVAVEVVDTSATRTGECRVLLKPSECFSEFMTALAARYG
jgi:hypothetical protein